MSAPRIERLWIPEANFDPIKLAALKTNSAKAMIEGNLAEAFNLESLIFQEQFKIAENEAVQASYLLVTARHFMISTQLARRTPITDFNKAELNPIVRDYKTATKTCLLEAHSIISIASGFHYDPEEATEADLGRVQNLALGNIPKTVESIANLLSATYQMPIDVCFEVAKERERALTILNTIGQNPPTENTWKGVEESTFNYYSKILEKLS